MRCYGFGVTVTNYTNFPTYVVVSKVKINTKNKPPHKHTLYQHNNTKMLINQLEYNLLPKCKAQTLQFYGLNKNKYISKLKECYVSVWMLINTEWRLIAFNKYHNHKYNINIIGF